MRLFAVATFLAASSAFAQSPSTPSLPPLPPSPGGPLSSRATLPPAPAKLNPLDRLTPVTDAQLQNPPAGEWLTWRRTYDDLGFSPLKQIDRANVAGLRVAWTWSLPNGPNENTPLVHDGVIFVHSFGDRVQALDAATGDLLWHYARQLPEGDRPSVKRNLSIYGGTLLVPTSDSHLVALDIKTGRVVWDHEIGDYKQNRVSGGPLVAKGKVMQGVTGSSPGGNYIVALDAATGREAWRFYTIARPGEPGGDSWNGLPLEKRNGGSVWTAGSYDPALNLVYFGVAQTYDTGPLLHPVNQPGITNDALYTDSTVALNPDTGKLVWHFQHMPNDQWDLDWAFERQLIKLPVNGTMRTIAVTAGKEAIYDAVDAATGKYDFSIDLGLQNVVTAIDPKTGAKTINPKVVPGDGTDPSWSARTPAAPRTGSRRPTIPTPRSSTFHSSRSLHGSRSRASRQAPLPVIGRQLHHPAAPGQRRQVWPLSGHQPDDPRSGLDPATARATNHRRARHRGRHRLQRFARPLHSRLRRLEWKSAVGDAPQRRAELLPHHLHASTASSTSP